MRQRLRKDAEKQLQKRPFFVDILPNGSCQPSGMPSIQSDVHLALALCTQCCEKCCCQHVCYRQVEPVRKYFHFLTTTQQRSFLVDVVQRALEHSGQFFWIADDFEPMPICMVGYCILLGISTKRLARVKNLVAVGSDDMLTDLRMPGRAQPQSNIVRHFVDTFLIPNATNPHVGSSSGVCPVNNKERLYVSSGCIFHWYEQFKIMCQGKMSKRIRFHLLKCSIMYSLYSTHI